MGNMMDYVRWRGDLTMERDPFNQVDSLILSELAYTELEDLVPPIESGMTVSLRQVGEDYAAAGRDQSYLINNPGPMLLEAAASVRFGALRLGGYVNEIDEEKQIQFAALHYHLPDGSIYVAFRGTDNSIVGWREDFNFSYLTTPGQARAVQYLEQVARMNGVPLSIGGHSKGGHLAIYAAAFCSEPVKARIRQVDSFDGPGFDRPVTENPAYLAVLNRVRLVLPEASLVGILLDNKARRQIVHSTGEGLRQHDPYTWEVLGTRLVPATQLSPRSTMMDTVLRRWLSELDDQQRANLVSAIFDSLEASGADTLTELESRGPAAYSNILKAVMDMAPEQQKDVRETLKKLGSAGWDVIREELRHTMEEFTNRQETKR